MLPLLIVHVTIATRLCVSLIKKYPSSAAIPHFCERVMQSAISADDRRDGFVKQLSLNEDV